MMESAPTTEAVYQGVYTLYNNTNTVEQEKASKWLEQLQNSVSGENEMKKKSQLDYLHAAQRKKNRNLSLYGITKNLTTLSFLTNILIFNTHSHPTRNVCESGLLMENCRRIVTTKT